METTRRKTGTGSITEEDGRFCVRLRLGNGKRRRLGAYETREIAQEQLDAALHVLADAPHVVRGGKTLRDWGAEFLELRRGKRPNTNHAPEHSRWHRHIATAPFAALPLREITQEHVQEWIDALPCVEAVPGKAVGDFLDLDTVRKLRSLLSAAFIAAQRKKLVKTNPVVGVLMPEPDDEAPGTPWTFLELEEIRRIEDLLRSDDPRDRAYGAIYVVAIYTGLRRGELWGLQWVDVTMEGPRQFITVRRSNKRKPKGGKIRHVPLLPRAVEVLRWWRTECPETADSWVFPAPRTLAQRRHDDRANWPDRSQGRGRPMTPGYCSRLLERPVRFHDLRHTTASHLVMGTWGRPWSLEEIATFLGHAQVATTNRYAHLSERAMAAAAATTTGTSTPAPVPLTGADCVLEADAGSPIQGRTYGATSDYSSALLGALNRALELARAGWPGIGPAAHEAGAELADNVLKILVEIWRAMRDSNARPLAPEGNKKRHDLRLKWLISLG